MVEEKRRVIIAATSVVVVSTVIIIMEGVLPPVLVVLEVVTTTTRRRTIVTMNDNIQVHPMDIFVVYVTSLVIGYNSVLKKMRLIINNVNNSSIINNNIINVINIGWKMVAAVAVVAIIRMRGSIIVTS